MGYVDLHLHLLPGVDDGPPTLRDALEHAHAVASDGVEEAVVTPHVGHPRFPLVVSEIPRRTEQLRRALTAAGIPLRLRAGGEIHAEAVDRLSRSALETLAQGPPQARWVLLEAPFAGLDEHFLASVRRLREMGFGAVVAHPERSAGGHALLRELIAGGAVLQVDTCSLLGAHGPHVRERAIRMVRDGSAYVLASDGHGGARAHTLRRGDALAVAAAGVSAQRAAQLTAANPRFLLQHGLPAPLSAAAASPPAHA